MQRSRWAHGNLALGKSQALHLIGAGIRHRNLLLLDLGATLLLLSRPLVLLHLAATLLLAAALNWLAPGPLSRWLWQASLLVLVGDAAYLALGVISLGMTATRFQHLLRAPWVIARLAAISCLALVRPRPAAWTRTPRE